jgi:GrpB-like predicted nucleotidyltransferase (UPF0157 family)
LSDGAEYVRPPQPLRGRIELHEYDGRWPGLYAREEERLRQVLGNRVVRVEHAGSTSVPGLPAKPIVDIVLEVPDTRSEAAYVPALEAAGYTLTIREPDWFEHRLFKGPDTNINLHVFSRACSEVDRMVVFRDWLRTYAPDRDLYLRAKRRLAERDWEYVQDYADAKSDVVAEVMRRALVGSAARENAEWCDLHGGGTGEFRDGCWLSRVRTPSSNPDAVTLRPGVAIADVLTEIDTTAGCSIKDSFDELEPTGFSRLFRAQWLVARRETLPPPTGEFVLDGDDVAVLAGRGIAHRSTHVTGLGNLAPDGDWADGAALACTVWGHGTIVGYETTVPEGAEAVGPLSVWTNAR